MLLHGMQIAAAWHALEGDKKRFKQEAKMKLGKGWLERLREESATSSCLVETNL